MSNKENDLIWEEVKAFLDAEVITELEADKAYRDIQYAYELVEERRDEYREVIDIAKETRDSDWDDYNRAIAI